MTIERATSAYPQSVGLARFEPYMDARIKELFDEFHERLDALWAELKLERNRKELRGKVVEIGQLRMASDCAPQPGWNGAL